MPCVCACVSGLLVTTFVAFVKSCVNSGDLFKTCSRLSVNKNQGQGHTGNRGPERYH
jgi:hypothetical protein